MQLTKDCLHNSPLRRPTAEQLLATLEGMSADIDGPCGAVARADAVRQVVMMKAFIGAQSAMREQTNELAAKNEEIQQLHVQIQVCIVFYLILSCVLATCNSVIDRYCVYVDMIGFQPKKLSCLEYRKETPVTNSTERCSTSAEYN